VVSEASSDGIVVHLPSTLHQVTVLVSHLISLLSQTVTISLLSLLK